MSNWKQSFENQQCLQKVQESLTILESSSLEGTKSADSAFYCRLLKVLKVLEARFETIDPELFAPNTWGNFGQHLDQVKGYVTQFKQSRSIGHLQNANNSVETILTSLRPLDVAATKSTKAISSAAEAFQKKAFEEIERFQKKGKETDGQIDAFNAAIAQSKARLEENNQTIQQQKGRLDQSIAEFQKQFSQAEATRTTEFTNLTRKFSEEFATQGKSFDAQIADLLAKRKTDYDTFTANQKKVSDEHLQFLEKRKQEVNEIFGAIGQASLAGHFKDTADKDGRTANLLRWIALGLMAGMIFVGGLTFYHSLAHPEIDWKIFAFRLATTIIIAIPAVYMAQESSKHRERERKNRKLHLELASIDAYLILLPEPKRFELKEKLTEKFFGQPDALEKEDTVTKHAMFEVISSTVKNLTKH